MTPIPHQFSGGMAQRVMIAMALACQPKLIIADEPTTALDVTIQAQILDLLTTLQRDTGTALILITHSMGVVAETAEAVSVHYAGQKVEEQAVERTALCQPRHPYTAALLASLPERATGARCHPLPARCPDSLTARRAACSARAVRYAQPMCQTPPPLKHGVLATSRSMSEASA